MNFINNSGTSIKIYTYLTKEFTLFHWKETHRILNNHSEDLHQAQHSVYVWPWEDRPAGNGTAAVFRALKGNDLPFNTNLNKFLNTTSIVITPHVEKRLVDWKTATASYRTGAADVGANEATNNADMDTAMAAASAVITGLATGLAALGPVGALPGGLTAGLGLLILAVIGAEQQKPPPPLTGSEVEDIMTKVVRRELDRQDAEKAATAFSMASRTFLEQINLTYERLIASDGSSSGRDLTDHQIEDFERVLHSVTDLGGEGTLSFSVNHMAAHPEIARWILPAYLEGVGTYLTGLRIHTLWSGAEPGSDGTLRFSVTHDQVTAYLKELDRHRAGLEAALTAFRTYRDTEVKKQHLHDTEQGKILASLVTKSIFATDDFGPFETGLTNLGHASHKLQRDLATGDLSGFLGAATSV